jgi:hypothetical protein
MPACGEGFEITRQRLSHGKKASAFNDEMTEIGVLLIKYMALFSSPTLDCYLPHGAKAESKLTGSRSSPIGS